MPLGFDRPKPRREVLETVSQLMRAVDELIAGYPGSGLVGESADPDSLPLLQDSELPQQSYRSVPNPSPEEEHQIRNPDR